MFFIPNFTIVILCLPKLAFATKQLVCLMSGEGFMRLHDRFEICVFETSHQRMLMIRHHAPREEGVTRLCTKSQIPPALAAWSLSFALGGSFGVTVRYHLLQQRGVSIFRY